MDRRLHALLLNVLVLGGTAGGVSPARADDVLAAPADTPEVVEPRVHRRNVTVPAIDNENFEAGLFIGAVSIEDFGTGFLYGGRIAYHFTEDLFAEATVGSSKAGTTSYEDLSGSAQLLTDSERQYTYYDLAIGWNVLPGEVFFGSHHAMPAALYLTFGAGSTRFGGDDHFTLTPGVGYRLLLNDWLAVHVDGRDQLFGSDLLGKDKTTQNLQFSFSVTAFF
ncbi:MAG: outer membrane beta-barrel domain-containing protein [Steroidobacteraceae bacterium]